MIYRRPYDHRCIGILPTSLIDIQKSQKNVKITKYQKKHHTLGTWVTSRKLNVYCYFKDFLGWDMRAGAPHDPNKIISPLVVLIEVRR